MKKSYEIDMCNGPLFGKILLFTVPLMLSGVLQLLFNAADIVVVGRFAGSSALAAVGSTSSLINLLTNVFMGLSIGVNVLVAQYYGAQNQQGISETVHTAVATSMVCGVLMVIGIAAAGQLLTWMGTPEDVLHQSVLYMRLYFIGMPVMMLYNFGAAILRAIGDTRRPLYFLLMAGVVNVFLNLFFVTVLKLGVAGVALATVISQFISAALVVKTLMETPGALRLELKRVKICKDKLIRIAKIGLPAGMQGALFAISNVLVQSSVNSFGSKVMAGNTAANNIEGFEYVAMNSLYQTNLSFTSQNVGGKKYDRINKILYICLGTVTVVGLGFGLSVISAGETLLGIYSSDPEVLQYGMIRIRSICGLHFICGIMDCLVGSLRGMGYSLLPMFVSLTGICGVRILWIFTAFASHRTLEVLYMAYPISWTVTAVAQLMIFCVVRKRFHESTSLTD